MLHAKVLQFLGDVGDEIDRVFQQCARYCCRLCGAAGINKLFRLLSDLSTKQRDGIRRLKEWLDWGCYRNQLHRALWALSRYKRPAYKATARRTGLDPDELRFMFRTLGADDKLQLASTPEPQRFTEPEIVAVITALQPHIRRLTKRKLRYCYKNDRGLSKEDFWSELQCQAIKIIRNYEILGLQVDEMIPLVAQGLTNHTTNLAIYYGKDRRNPLQRVVERNVTRMAWYCNVNAELVEHVRAYTSPEYRRGDYCLVTFRSRTPTYVNTGRLHETREAAAAALRNYQRGQATRRTVVVDLTTTIQDDWQPTVTSLETPNSEDGTPLINYLPAPDEQPPIEFLTEDVARSVTDPRARMFIEVVRGDLAPLFDPYCLETTGRSSAELSEQVLGRVARKYCDITLKELTALIATAPS